MRSGQSTQIFYDLCDSLCNWFSILNRLYPHADSSSEQVLHICSTKLSILTKEGAKEKVNSKILVNGPHICFIKWQGCLGFFGVEQKIQIIT